MTSTIRTRRKRKELIEQGLCIRCQKPNLTNKYVHCEQCLEELRQKDRQKRKTWAEQGLCSCCGKEKENEGKVCESCLESGRQTNKRLRLVVFEHYGGAYCSCCGEKHIEFLCLDHINGDGGEHRKRDPSATKLYRWVKKNNFPEGFRVLCQNCNSSFGLYGYCPHNSE